MLTIYFSGTGNTAFVAQAFSKKMGTKCLSIEGNADFIDEISKHGTIVFCYPIYGSRVPLIMRKFTAQHMDALNGKKLIILVTQAFFSGDGARVFVDLFPKNHIEVVYADHISMPNNICNFSLFRRANKKRVGKQVKKAETQIERICSDIRRKVVKKRGFNKLSKLLGNFQGKAWQGDSGNAFANKNSIEFKAMTGVKINTDCTVCNNCVVRCPMKNLEINDGAIRHKNNCTMCYRCVNLCPKQAITVFIHKKPKWQYGGINVTR